MAKFSTYNTLIERLLSDTSETFHATASKVSAVNEAVEELLEMYNIPELIKRSTITFDANGNVAIPTEYFRMVKLWDVDSSGVETTEYKYIVEDEFDQQADTAAYFWTEDYVIASAARVLRVLPADSGTLQIRYVMKNSDVDSTDATDSGLDNRWNKVIAYGACKNLLINAGQYDESVKFEQEFGKRAAKVYLALKNRGGFKQGNRIKSRWGRESLLNR